ncbi:hypothetical protein Sango_2915900 [Sesamum angolense]|uniref:Uncharacterized protein n=1 Tax=Sesamum angolense TaxID=2727404 RepID=A0AAE1T5L3_9LAMI|nr:hypothetical protein Sango_2915900 [Sesamum angolense]
MMGMELKFSTANHPQTDGQTERVNALVEDYPRDCVSASQQVGWIWWTLPSSVTTCISHRLRELLDEAKDSLAKAQLRMKKYADMGRRHVEFSVEDQVLLKLTPQIWKNISLRFVGHGETANSTCSTGESKANATWEWDVTLWQFEEKLDEYWAVREGVRIRVQDNVGMERQVMDSQTDGRSGFQAVMCAGRHAPHNRRTGLADARAELGSSVRKLACRAQRADGLGPKSPLVAPISVVDTCIRGLKRCRKWSANSGYVDKRITSAIEEESSKTDAGYLKFMEQVQSGLIRKYWLTVGYCMLRWTGVCANGDVARCLLRETS